MTQALVTLTNDLAAQFGIRAGGTEIVDTLKQTAFKGNRDQQVSDAQMFALLVIAKQYRLNPWTREIYAYPDAQKGIVPVVGIDGWIRIVNEHPQCDGWEFEQDPANEFVTCRQFRKDRSRPLPATEYLKECERSTDPWRKMPRRMLRHKAFIQSARMAYGFAFYDDEEGATAAGVVIDGATGEIIGGNPSAPPPPARPPYNAEAFEAKLPEWAKLIDPENGRTASALLAKLSTKASFTEEQKARILSLKPAQAAAEPATPAPPPQDQPAGDKPGENDDFLRGLDAGEQQQGGGK